MQVDVLAMRSKIHHGLCSGKQGHWRQFFSESKSFADNHMAMTMQVDVLAMRSKVQRVHLQIKDICAILSGLVVAQNYKRGQQLITDRSFKVCTTYVYVYALYTSNICSSMGPCPCQAPYAWHVIMCPYLAVELAVINQSLRP